MTRSGTIITLLKTQIDEKKLNILKQKHGDITELREYSNGRVGAFFKDKQFRFVGLISKKNRNVFKASPKKHRKSPRKKKRSPKNNKKSPKNQTAGGAIELKQAVALLREHYFNL